MRKTSKNRADDDVISSTNGSMRNDDGDTVAANENEKGDDTNSGGDDGAEDQSEGNDRASDASFSETPKKTKLKKKTKKRKSEKAKAAEEYEVEKIIEAKKIKGKLHYLIRWKGYGADSDTWEPEKTVSCPDLITKFKEEKENTRKNKAEEKKSENKGKKRKSKSKDTNKSPAKKPKTDWDSSKADENEEYEVDRVLEVHHKKDGSREFLIHWKGWSNKFDSWEPEDNLNCSDLIKKFMEKVDDARKTQSRSLRVAPETTNRFTLQDPTSGRRLSKRRGQRQREEKRKELKRKKTNARQRAYYQRQKNLKKNAEIIKKVPKSNAERQRKFRQHNAEKSYMDIIRYDDAE